MRRMLRLICAFAVCFGALSTRALQLLGHKAARAAIQPPQSSIAVGVSHVRSNRPLRPSRVARSPLAEYAVSAAPSAWFAGDRFVTLQQSSWIEPLRKNHGSSAMRAPPYLPA